MSESYEKLLDELRTHVNIEAMRNWIKALRNGQYKQAFGALHNPQTNGYCCLGVLCNITKTREEKWVTISRRPTRVSFVGKDKTDNMGLPPWYKMAELFNINDKMEFGQFIDTYGGFTDYKNDLICVINPINTAPISVAYLNDQGVSFNEIADRLEQTYLPNDYAKPINKIGNP